MMKIVKKIIILKAMKIGKKAIKIILMKKFLQILIIPKIKAIKKVVIIVKNIKKLKKLVHLI